MNDSHDHVEERNSSMTGLGADTLNAIFSWGSWTAVGSALLAALAGTMTYLASAELDRRSDQRLSENEKVTALAQASAATANQAAANAGVKAAQLQVQSADLQKQAGELQHRTAMAELETQRLRDRVSWRSLTASQAADFVGHLKRFAGQEYNLSVAHDHESRAFLAIVDAALKHAGWVRKPPSQDYAVAPEVNAAIVAMRGVHIAIAPESQVAQPADALRGSFVAAGIPAVVDRHPEFANRPREIALVVGFKELESGN